jgi:hypothetical protein
MIVSCGRTSRGRCTGAEADPAQDTKEGAGVSPVHIVRDSTACLPPDLI